MQSNPKAMNEGPEAYTRFAAGMKKVLTIPHAIIKERIEEEKRKSAAKQVRPRPKRKSKPSAFPVPAA